MKIDKYGVIYINVSLHLETDVDEEEIESIVSEMDYEFRHRHIADTKINGYEVENDS
jgi:hypothetical protein